MTVIAEMKLVADIEHGTDIEEIGNCAVTSTPALVINGEVKAIGAMPKMPKLKALLSEASKKNLKA